MDDTAYPQQSSNSPRKAIAVAAGESHTLALTGDGCVYTWGRGMFGRLGTDSEADELFPVRIKFEVPGRENIRIVGIAAGAYHNLALADDGSIWSWGYNIYGQLGFDGENAGTPCLLEHFLELGSPHSVEDVPETKSNQSLKVCSVKAGGMMSLAIDNQGGLWMWGNCPQKNDAGQGGFSLLTSYVPIPVRDFHGHIVVKVACGSEHVVALVSAGETGQGEDLVCYAWGNNSHGQLGLGDRESRTQAHIIQTFNQDLPCSVYEVACGSFHTVFLTRSKRASDRLESMCWTFGLGENGQLGHGTTQSLLLPEPVKELPQNVYLVSVDCGLFHTSVVSSTGDVWSWGMEKGLGLCPDATFTGTDSGDALLPLLVSHNRSDRTKFQDPVQIACGAAHTVLVSHDGYKIWSWGRGRSGVLGNGNTIDCYTPTIVLWPPLDEDFKQGDLNTTDKKPDNTDKISEGDPETEKKLSLAMEEMRLLQSKLSMTQRYAGILHGAIFGKPFEDQDIPKSLQNSGSFDITREWENMLESVDQRELRRLEVFYQNMLAGVKDKLLKRRVQELIRESLASPSRT